MHSELLLALLLAGPAHAAGTLPLNVAGQTLQVEVAATPQARQRGLMGRTRLPADGGMLFVFERPGRHCFWMRNTPLPLFIAFLDAGGRVVGTADMQPHSESLHCPDRAARYALEISQTSVARPYFAPGVAVEGLPR